MSPVELPFTAHRFYLLDGTNNAVEVLKNQRMRTSSMSSGTTLLSRAPPAPQSQPQQTISSSIVGNNQGPNLIGQLPSSTNPALLKAAGQNFKMFQASNAMPAVGSIINHHRGTPPSIPPTFQFHPQRPNQLPQNPQQRLLGFQPQGLETPVLNNESEFPSLNTRSSPAPLHPPNTPNNNNIFGSTAQNQFINLQQAMSMYPSSTKDVLNSMQQQQRMPYANTLSRVVDTGYGQTSEFTLQSEDFPALPGASQHQLMQGSLNAAVGGGTSLSSSSGQTNSSESQLLSGQTNFGAQSNFYNNTARASDFFTNGANENGKDISINASNGVVSNVPPGMLCDQYGIVGLLMFMKGLDHCPGLSVLSIGVDITKLGLNMNTNGNLYQSFGGPWAEQPCRIQEYDAKVPDEYLTNSVIREKLPTIKMNKLAEDILFYLFYNCPSQIYQLAAASELYVRDWRYHKVDAVWLTRMPYGGVKEQTQEYEMGSYHIFDPVSWRKISKEMKLEYKMLEGKPMPANTSINGSTVKSLKGFA